MRRLEIVHVRWTGPRSGDVAAAVREAAADLNASGRVEIYRREGVATDVSIHLRHGADPSNPELAILAARLVAALREVGMVDHSIWLES